MKFEKLLLAETRFLNRVMKTILLLIIVLPAMAFSQNYRWQQRVDYQMDVELNDENHTITGKQKLIYENNSPEALTQVFYHLYFNAFQPGSAMDMRTRNLPDPDSRLSRIGTLEKDQQGFQKVKSLKMNGLDCNYKMQGTILQVTLPKAIGPKSKATFEMEFEAQVPIQIRRSGRSNAEGVAYSMAQWYPKMCNYDEEGWHAHPYIGREFYGIWGNFNVNITLPSEYMVGGTGILTNASEIGKGYGPEPKKSISGGKHTWKFKAENVHDFMWAADKDYLHETKQVPGGPVLHFIFQDHPDYTPHWRAFQDDVVRAFQYMSENFGKYPWPQFTVIQGGDGGMEYPMATLVTGHRQRGSLLGVTIHEAAHSWYYGALASNESLHEWMDEGMTSYMTAETMAHLTDANPSDSHDSAYQNYFSIVADKEENPLSTHADHYQSNRAYGVAAYSKGEVLIAQLGYVIGRENLHRGLKEYFESWKFRHPNPTDLRRVMEKVSGLQLDWYFRYMVQTTETIDYSLGMVMENENGTQIIIGIERKGDFPMPIDLSVVMSDGRIFNHHVPLDLMYGAKPKPTEAESYVVEAPWEWTNPYYYVRLPVQYEDVTLIEIDPTGKLADVNRENNYIEVMPQLRFYRE